MFEGRLADIPDGYSVVLFQGRKWGLSKSVMSRGRSVKIYAEQLGGSDIISCNLYRTGRGLLLKPCEMPEEKVMEFLMGFSLLD